MLGRLEPGIAMQQLAHLALIGLAGAVGTLLRAGCSGLVTRLLGPGFPWGTLAVNVAGSFAFGAIMGWVRSRHAVPDSVETVLLIGLLGGFTTYSSYAFQSVELLEGGRPIHALGYMLATNLVALAAAWAGLRALSGP
jgi:CrcB protein